MLVSWYRKSNLIHAPKSKLLCRQAHVYVYEHNLNKKKKKKKIVGMVSNKCDVNNEIK